jgi:hypothetical protein
MSTLGRYYLGIAVGTVMISAFLITKLPVFFVATLQSGFTTQQRCIELSDTRQAEPAKLVTIACWISGSPSAGWDPL